MPTPSEIAIIQAFDGMSADDIERLLAELPEKQKRELDILLSTDPVVWRPLPGPQTMAFHSKADVTGFGGAAGGGKSALGIGLAMTSHKRSFIVREEATQLAGIIDEIAEIVGSRDGYNGQERVWRLPPRFSQRGRRARQIEFGSVPNPGDEKRYQGRPKDLLVLDEATNLRESAARFLMGWVRTTDPSQRCRTLMTFNPPTDAEGRWVIDYFAPWLDESHPAPAEPGEIRWFATMDGKDREVLSGDRFEYRGEIIIPQSRTFIPSRISDNPYLLKTGYMATLQALPEPLRSQMLYGDFKAGMEDDQWQVIPTSWVQAAQARWRRLDRKPPMDSMGVDVARGGKDSTTVARRHGAWYDEPLKIAGKLTPDGPSVAGQVIAAVRDMAPIHIDVIGVGASPYDFLVNLRQQVIGVNVAEAATQTDKSGRLRFMNLRTQLWWKFREALDPANNIGIALPPSRELLIDLTAPNWKVSGAMLYVESREEIIKRIGRSPDMGTAYVLASMDTPKTGGNYLERKHEAAQRVMNYDPYDNLRRT